MRVVFLAELSVSGLGQKGIQRSTFPSSLNAGRGGPRAPATAFEDGLNARRSTIGTLDGGPMGNPRSVGTRISSCSATTAERDRGDHRQLATTRCPGWRRPDRPRAIDLIGRANFSEGDRGPLPSAAGQPLPASDPFRVMGRHRRLPPRPRTRWMRPGASESWSKMSLLTVPAAAFSAADRSIKRVRRSASGR